MRNIENILLTEKYRPKTLDDLITPARVNEKLSKGVYQHLLITRKSRALEKLQQLRFW